MATYVTTAFGPTLGGISGWLYFVAGSVGQTIVPLTAATTCPRLSASTAVANPHASVHRLTPFVPHGIGPIGSSVIILFYAFAGWEAVAHLVAEFADPDSDVPRAVAATIAIITVLYLGVAAAVVLTGTYGDPRTDHVALGLRLRHAFGDPAGIAAAAVAAVISLASTNAYVAAPPVSPTAWAATDGCRRRRPGSADRPPVGGVLAVALVAYAGIGAAALFHRGPETLVLVPFTFVVAVYLLAAIAGVRL